MPHLEALVESHLVCPTTRLPLSVADNQITAAGSSFVGRMQDGVAVMLSDIPTSFFDDKFGVMQGGHEEKGGEWQFAYAQQIALVEERLRRGGLAVDVGCGPFLPYAKPANTFVIGLEYSLPSIAANHQVDLRVCASAAAMPLADKSVDTIVCFYSLHHMIGANIAATEALMSQVLGEFARVMKPGGEVLIFEMAPIPPLGFLERILWNPSKQVLGARLDQFFWPVSKLRAMALAVAPAQRLMPTEFVSPAWTTFPPIFSLQWLRLPRFLYPLTPVLYRWKFSD